MGSLHRLDRRVPPLDVSTPHPSTPVLIRPGVLPTPPQLEQIIAGIVRDLHEFAVTHREEAVVAAAECCRFYKGEF